MCCFCNCLSWTLDLLQRAITFCLACCAAFVICGGLIVTAVAGVAYGYNYSFAEFISQSNPGLRLYIHRGQFKDHPHLAIGARRMGDKHYDVLSSNFNSDYEESNIINEHSKLLADGWMKDNDAQEYARKLTKYSGAQSLHFPNNEIKEQPKIQTKTYYTTTLPAMRRLSKIPILIPTTVWRSGSSEIIMRNFLPLNDIREDMITKEPEDYFYKQDNHNQNIKPSAVEYRERQMEPLQPDRTRFEDIPERKLMPINDYAPNPEETDEDKENIPDIDDEDSIMYKPV